MKSKSKYAILSVTGLILAGLTLFCSCNDKDESDEGAFTRSQCYYYSNGNKINLMEIASKQFVMLKDGADTAEVRGELQTLGCKVGNFKNISSEETTIVYWCGLDNVKQPSALHNMEEIIYHAPFVKTNEGDTMGVTQLFLVKLETESDIHLLQQVAEATNVTIIGNDDYQPLWYFLVCTKASKGNALQMAAYFYETKYFASAQPEFLYSVSLCKAE